MTPLQLIKLPKLIYSHKPTHIIYVTRVNMTEHRSPSEHLISSNDNFEWAKPVVMELLVIRMSRSFAAKPADHWVSKHRLNRDPSGYHSSSGCVVKSVHLS